MKFEWVGKSQNGCRKFILSHEDFKSAKIVMLSDLEKKVFGHDDMTAYGIAKTVREAIRDIAFAKTGNFRAFDDQLQSVMEQIQT